ncbi:cleavage stimulation factor subunit 2 isoform X2 [Anoplophora glabripennis]|uniref:cleavage stimulation factor subunit 2 isoform X2 n=1 Tax=Anoplophora glabripennis TaxID=217634 RepID=UPI0008752D25|nr:cleavage stimulation factor subunit 2 isoform X2 [Anoplophora glabripennis]
MDNLEANIMDKSMRSVFVGNIPYEATEEKLKDIFGEVGQVLSFKLVFDRETGKPKGYGFCEYRDQETALSAMRNLNGYEIGGRNLRVDNACTEKSRMEMQNLLNQPPVENPYGEPIQAEKAPEAISKAVASLPPEQMFELMKQMKTTIQNNPTEARQMLLQNPQLAYALLQAQVVMKIIDPHTAATLLHPINQVPATLMPGDKNVPVQVPINSQFTQPPAPVQPPRQEFQPVPAPVMHPNPQAPVFTGQDVDLRSLGAAPDPRIARMGDQDMRQIPGPLQNPLPPPVGETITKQLDIKMDSFIRDPRETRDPRDLRDPRANTAAFPTDPRQVAGRVDPRQKNIAPPHPPQNQIPPQPVRPPVQPPVVPPPQPVQGPPRPAPATSSPGIGPAGASDQEKAALIMQVLQLSDEQIAMLPPEQRNSILVLKEQIAKSAHRT